MDKRTQLSFDIRPELLVRLKVVAAKKQVSVAKIMRDFVSWYVEKEERGE